MSRTPRHTIANFGDNIRFLPAQYSAPRTEAEVLELLDAASADGKTVRVVGARHAWSPGICSDDVLIDLKHFDHIVTEAEEDVVWARVGGGCRIQHVLDTLRLQIAGTMPSIGLITRQTIAGAMATGTHGSGRPCLSHYAASIRIAAFDPETGEARIYIFDSGDELRAAQCSLGCLGVVLEVCFRCVPQYLVAEHWAEAASLDDVLSSEANHSLQQFFLIPFLDRYFVQKRDVVTDNNVTASWYAPLYRIYWLLAFDITFHLNLKLLLAVRSKWLLSLFYRRVLPRTLIRDWQVVDRSDRMLTMQHQLFRHVEIEVFVPRSHLERAMDFVRHVIHVFADTPHASLETVIDDLTTVSMGDRLEQLRGTFAHHYPICVRKVVCDQTLISMASRRRDRDDEAYYAISFITYRQPREPFYRLADFLAQAMTQLYDARLHWGKYFPLDAKAVAPAYPNLETFRRLCRQVDPHGTFHNPFVRRALGFDPRDDSQ